MKDHPISPDMTVLEVIDRYRNTESVFKKYDEQAEVFICCHALFETHRLFSEKYRLNLERLLSDLKEVIPIGNF